MFSAIFALALANAASAARFVVADKKTNSAFVASFKQDPTAGEIGNNDVLAMAMGTEGVLGRSPPYVFVAYVNASVKLEQLGDANNLFQKKINVNDAAALLYAHWGLGEYCDIDNKPGFDGPWPPNFGDLVKTAFSIGLSTEPFKTDTFLTAASWEQAKFAPLATGNDGTRKWAEINTADNAKGFAVYSMRCRSGDKQDFVGEFRFKCDFTIRPDGSWFDQNASKDRNPLVGNLTADEALTKNKGCGPEKRKIALLAFLAGTSIKETPSADMGVKNWLRVPIGDAEFAYVNQIQLLDASGKDTGKNFTATAQIKPVADIVDTKNWPPFLKESRAILFTFEASRADMQNGEQIYFDPTFGFAQDPSAPKAPASEPPKAPATVPPKGSSASAMNSLLAVILAIAFTITQAMK